MLVRLDSTASTDSPFLGTGCEDMKFYSANGNGQRVFDETDVLDDGKAKQYWINQDLCLTDRKAQFFVRQERRKRLLVKVREETTTQTQVQKK